MDISFYCYKCGQHLVIDEAGTGVQIECPKCRTALTVPPRNPQAVQSLPPPVSKPPAVKSKRTERVVVTIACLGGVIWAIILGVSFLFDLFSNSDSDIRKEVKIVNWSWYRAGFDNVMIARFTIQNNSSFDIKDITIKCTHTGKSGTVIDSNTRTIYEIIRAGETKTISEFNMGIIHSQAVRSSAGIEDFTVIR